MNADKPQRTNNPERTMADILKAATIEFADKGLSGARIDSIAEATQTSKRMIYYYFGSKEGLYVAVLEDEYRHMREVERVLHAEVLPPIEALKKLVGTSFDYHIAHPNFVRLVMNENIHRGQYLAQSRDIQKLNTPAIAALTSIYEQGVAAKVFRPGLDVLELHMSISSLCFYCASNKYTFSLIFKRDLAQTKHLLARRNTIIDMILRFVLLN
jgi:AcrR family transcriptional regulator